MTRPISLFSSSLFSTFRSRPIPARLSQHLLYTSTQLAIPESPSSLSPAAPSETAEAMRMRAIKLYKELHRLGRDYPDPAYGFNKRLRRAYEKNAKITDPAVMKKQLELAEHIKKEVLALISLKKFRHLRRSYHAHEGPR